MMRGDIPWIPKSNTRHGRGTYQKQNRTETFLQNKINTMKSQQIAYKRKQILQTNHPQQNQEERKEKHHNLATKIRLPFSTGKIVFTFSVTPTPQGFPKRDKHILARSSFDVPCGNHFSVAKRRRKLASHAVLKIRMLHCVQKGRWKKHGFPMSLQDMAL